MEVLLSEEITCVALFSLVVCCACNGHTLYCHLICSGDLLKKIKKGI